MLGKKVKVVKTGAAKSIGGSISRGKGKPVNQSLGTKMKQKFLKVISGKPKTYKNPAYREPMAKPFVNNAPRIVPMKRKMRTPSNGIGVGP